jgi:hypothetical protein
MKKQGVKFVCKKCGKEPEKDKGKSNENWAVFENKPCAYCGGELTIELI